jgi:hypothetical protein
MQSKALIRPFPPHPLHRCSREVLWYPEGRALIGAERGNRVDPRRTARREPARQHANA